jgi:hypothetical protein
MKYLYSDFKFDEWQKIHFKTKQRIYREILYNAGFLDDTVVSLLARIIFYKKDFGISTDGYILPKTLQKNLDKVLSDIKYSCYGQLTTKNLRTYLTKLKKSEHRTVLIRSHKNSKAQGNKGINIVLSEVDYKKLDFIISTKHITKKTFIRDCISLEYQKLKNEVKNDK